MTIFSLNNIRLKIYVWLLIISPVSVSGQFSEDWKLSAEGASFVEKDNREILYLTRGSAENVTLNFENGTIEFDLKVSSERAFAYVYFRQKSRQESEVVYFRTHKSNAPDTIQYAPVYQGSSAWQIYHHDKGTASAYLPDNQWTRVKLKIDNNTLSIWVGDQTEPVMNNVRLTGPKGAGKVSLRGFIPRASHASYSAYFRNVVVKPTTRAAPLAVSENGLASNVLGQFLFSPAFEAKKEPTNTLPEAINQARWQSLDPGDDGVYELLRWIEIPGKIRQWAAAGDTLLISPRNQTCALNLGFSDTLTLLLNDEPLLFSDASYRYAENRQEGLLHDKQITVYLSLVEGENRLRAVVGDSFGGWGLTASLSGCQDVEQKRPLKHH